MAKQRDQQGGQREQATAMIGQTPQFPPTPIVMPAVMGDEYREHNDSVDVHRLAWELYIASAPSHRGAGRTYQALARDCYAQAREFLAVRQEKLADEQKQLQAQDAQERPTQ